MTKFFSAQVEVQLTKTVVVQVSAENEADAAEMARSQARLKDPAFTIQKVVLTLLGESQLSVGSRVVHKIFGPGIIEKMQAVSSNNEFTMQIRFDTGDIKRITGPGPFIRPESIAAAGT